MTRRVLVCGGRSYNNTRHVFSILDAEHARSPISCIISGMATGADVIAVSWARQHGVPFDPYPAQWDDLSHPDAVIRTKHGRRYDANAGFRRNQSMIDKGKPNLVIAFPGHTGTADMIERAKTARIAIVTIASI